jgi:hypothetical protein
MSILIIRFSAFFVTFFTRIRHKPKFNFYLKGVIYKTTSKDVLLKTVVNALMDFFICKDV